MRGRARLFPSLAAAATALACGITLPVRAGTASAVGVGAWAGQVHEYANPFDPNLDRAPTESSLTWGSGWSGGIDQIVSRVDGREATKGGGRISRASGAPGPATYMNLVAPSTFAAGTVIACQQVWSGFTSSMPYTLKLSNGDPGDWSAVPATFSGPGTATYETIQVATPGSAADRARIEYSQTAIYGSTAYADFNDLLILPDRLETIPTVTATATSTTWGSPSSLVNLTCESGWAKHTGLPADVSVTFTLNGGESETVKAIVFYSYENVSATFTLRDAADNPVMDVVLTIEPQGWALPVYFDTPITTTAFKMDFGYATTQVAMREVIFMRQLAAPIPEPAAGLLLTGGALLLVRRRGRRA
ncbi:MAG: hypothetical protein BWZ02_00624 [Lentisphaerae bacterium ADurb.BinA184]|nr:MAG: hypothetical protein BWZ02_00624 [Lentisphaerae bacterium ADurb.BinA184]